MGAASASEEGEIDAIRDRFAAELQNLQEVRAQVAGDDRYAAAIGAMDALAAFGTGDGDIFAARSDQMTAIASGRRTLGANRRLQRLLENEIDKIVATHLAEIARQASGAVSTIERGIGYLRAISAVSVVVAILIAWLYAGRNLTRRLRKLATNMRDLAAGNLEVAVPTGGSDEIASMADAMQIFKDNAIERRRLLDEQSQMAIKGARAGGGGFPPIGAPLRRGVPGKPGHRDLDHRR
jgi:methyl-accepting chemotaxis protein